MNPHEISDFVSENDETETEDSDFVSVDDDISIIWMGYDEAVPGGVEDEEQDSMPAMELLVIESFMRVVNYVAY